MSTPGRAYFCRNGHLLASYAHDEYGIDEDENRDACKECGSTDIAVQWEWGDDDYPQYVSTIPEKVINIYFVKGLFAVWDEQRRESEQINKEKEND